MPTLAIYGRHPQLELGFNGAMSYYEALAFLERGWDVSLFLPSHAQFDPHKQLAKLGLSDFADLELGDRIAIRVIEADTAVDERYDVMIWQAYNPADEAFWPKMRAAARLTTKSQPRLFAGDPAKDRGRGVGTSKRYDLVGLALKDDYLYAKDNGFFGREPDGFAYVPRGVSPTLLHPGLKTERPSIGFDRAIEPSDDGQAAVAHIVRLVERLRKRWPDLEVFQVGSRAHVDGATLVNYRPMRSFYDDFINRIWVYVSFDFRHSIHNKTLHQHPSGRRVHLGLYENQIIETQMSGGLVAAAEADVADELLSPRAGLRYPDHDQERAVFAAVARGIERFDRLSPVARAFAERRHSYSVMGERWTAALAGL